LLIKPDTKTDVDVKIDPIIKEIIKPKPIVKVNPNYTKVKILVKQLIIAKSGQRKGINCHTLLTVLQ